ncbi:hypothetical protein ADEAN_000888300 [Angomonas deanei]|uniref:Uncharacterized protein n=1 Tax=Angomonas deanei TaxID=59799 RepID=A0A7G2CQT2_9TRYP|nr:hypothetical protein ADEAN_000888300 [Angomonas deanei]
MGALCSKSREGNSFFIDCDSYFGSCWLLSSSKESFSPSRWFPVNDHTLNGRRNKKRAFSISSNEMSTKERSKCSFLLERNVSVPEGLEVTGYNKITIATFSAGEMKEGKTLMVGGVHFSVPAVEDTHCVLTVVTVKRMELEMVPAQHEVRHYTRHRIRAPPQNDEDRQTVGEGCITGEEFGGFFIVASDNTRLAREVTRILTKRLGEDASVTQESHKGAADTLNDETTKFNLIYSSIPVLLTNEMSMKERVDSLACSVVDLYCSPRNWRITALFLQRYEAIGCLLT